MSVVPVQASVGARTAGRLFPPAGRYAPAVPPDRLPIRDPPHNEALRAWCALPRDTTLDDAAHQLMAFPVEVRARAALAALRAVLEEDDPDPDWRRPQQVADAVDGWLSDPSESRRAAVQAATSASEQAWNAVAGDLGQPAPAWQTATYAGWVVTDPDQPWSVVHALTGAAKARSPSVVLAVVQQALLP